MRIRAALIVVLLVPACGRNRQVPGVVAPDGGGGADVAVAEGVSYAEEVWPILQLRCQTCHTTGIGAEQVPDMLMTDPSTLYLAWINVRAQCTTNLPRVFPGNSGLSFVYDKISKATPLCGQRMPLQGPPLDEAEQRTIQDWIDQGARRN